MTLGVLSGVSYRLRAVSNVCSCTAKKIAHAGLQWQKLLATSHLQLYTSTRQVELGDLRARRFVLLSHIRPSDVDHLAACNISMLCDNNIMQKQLSML